MINNKKAQMQFLPYFLIGIVFVVALSIFALSITHIGDRVFDELKQNNYINSSNESVESVTQVQGLMTTASDQLIFFFLGAILLGFIALAIFSDFHPIFLGVFFLFLVLMVILGGILANANDEVKNTDILSNKSGEFTMTNLVLGSKLPIFIAVFGAVAIIILLAKRGKAVAPV